MALSGVEKASLMYKNLVTYAQAFESDHGLRVTSQKKLGIYLFSVQGLVLLAMNESFALEYSIVISQPAVNLFSRSKHAMNFGP
jgi:hypothetical protein